MSAVSGLDVVSVGEAVIDFTPADCAATVPVFAQEPGGAAYNVALASTAMGARTLFVGHAGADQFGRFLQTTLERHGARSDGLTLLPGVTTTLAFVHLDDAGERSFSVVGFPGAEARFRMDSIPWPEVTDAWIVHLSMVLLLGEESREAAFELLGRLRTQPVLVSFDVNYRPGLLPESELIGLYTRLLPAIDILKVTEEELAMITGEPDLEKAAKDLVDAGASLVTVTAGSNGSYFANRRGFGHVEAFQVDAVDSNGAGDAFMGALLAQLGRDRREPKELDEQELREILTFCNAAAALSVRGKGAVSALPSQAEVTELIASAGRR